MVPPLFLSRRLRTVCRPAWPVLLVFLMALASVVRGKMTGGQQITPHDYQSLGRGLAQSAPSCGFPYVTLDISRITAVQRMEVGHECGTCLRVETAPQNYIEDGATVGIPDVAMATHFAATTTSFEQLPTTVLAAPLARRGADEVRYIYVLAVDTGGLGLDMAQVSFTALFGQSLSPTAAVWFPVDGKYCQDIWRNTTARQLKNPTSMAEIPIYYGRSEAPAGLVDTLAGNRDTNAAQSSSAGNNRVRLGWSLMMLFAALVAAAML